MENVKENISAHRTTSIIVGILILAAYSVIAGGNPDARILGMAVEVFSGIAVIIIAILMFRIFMPFDKKLSGWYLVFRLLEGALLVVTGILFLSREAEMIPETVSQTPPCIFPIWFTGT